MKFYLKTQGKLFGPYTREQIRSGVRSGKIKSDYLISNSKDGAFKKITQQFLSGESENVSATTGGFPPALGDGSSFESPTGIQLSRTKRKNIKKSVSRRERLKGSSVAPTAAHAFSHSSSLGARMDALNETVKKGKASQNQWLGLALFGGLVVFILGAILLVTSLIWFDYSFGGFIPTTANKTRLESGLGRDGIAEALAGYWESGDGSPKFPFKKFTFTLDDTLDGTNGTFLEEQGNGQFFSWEILRKGTWSVYEQNYEGTKIYQAEDGYWCSVRLDNTSGVGGVAQGSVVADFREKQYGISADNSVTIKLTSLNKNSFVLEPLGEWNKALHKHGNKKMSEDFKRINLYHPNQPTPLQEEASERIAASYDSNKPEKERAERKARRQVDRKKRQSPEYWVTYKEAEELLKNKSPDSSYSGLILELQERYSSASDSELAGHLAWEMEKDNQPELASPKDLKPTPNGEGMNGEGINRAVGKSSEARTEKPAEARGEKPAKMERPSVTRPSRNLGVDPSPGGDPSPRVPGG